MGGDEPRLFDCSGLFLFFPLKRSFLFTLVCFVCFLFYEPFHFLKLPLRGPLISILFCVSCHKYNFTQGDNKFNLLYLFSCFFFSLNVISCDFIYIIAPKGWKGKIKRAKSKQGSSKEKKERKARKTRYYCRWSRKKCKKYIYSLEFFIFFFWIKCFCSFIPPFFLKVY